MSLPLPAAVAVQSVLRGAISASANPAMVGAVGRSMRLPPLPSVRDLVKLYKLKAMKQLSQNFLLDEKLSGKIVKAAGRLENAYVVEVGPGPGGITRAILMKHPKKLILVEKDKRFAPSLSLLRHACPPETLEIYWGDVLSFEMSKMIPEEEKTDWMDGGIPPIHVLGNLPFSIATPLIIRWLSAMSEKKNIWSFGRVPLTLTFQLEVAERLVADTSPEQEHRRSRLSIMAQYLCYCHHKFTIPGSGFVPKPDVDVGVVKFIPRKEPLIRHEFSLVEKVVRQTFCMRQKYCRRGIATLFPEMVRVHFTQQIFRRSGVVTTRRPFELTIEEFAALCDVYAEICREYPSLREYNYRGFEPDTEWEAMYGHAYQQFKLDRSAIKELDPPEPDPKDPNFFDPEA